MTELLVRAPIPEAIPRPVREAVEVYNEKRYKDVKPYLQACACFCFSSCRNQVEQYRTFYNYGMAPNKTAAREMLKGMDEDVVGFDYGKERSEPDGATGLYTQAFSRAFGDW